MSAHALRHPLEKKPGCAVVRMGVVEARSLTHEAARLAIYLRGGLSRSFHAWSHRGCSFSLAAAAWYFCAPPLSPPPSSPSLADQFCSRYVSPTPTSAPGSWRRLSLLVVTALPWGQQRRPSAEEGSLRVWISAWVSRIARGAGEGTARWRGPGGPPSCAFPGGGGI